MQVNIDPSSLHELIIKINSCHEISSELYDLEDFGKQRLFIQSRN